MAEIFWTNAVSMALIGCIALIVVLIVLPIRFVSSLPMRIWWDE